MLAPSFVGQLGLKVTPAQVVAALMKAGFAAVKEVAIGADLTACREAKELMEKVPSEQKYMTSSCCPSFVNMIKNIFLPQKVKFRRLFHPWLLVGAM